MTSQWFLRFAVFVLVQLVHCQALRDHPGFQQLTTLVTAAATKYP